MYCHGAGGRMLKMLRALLPTTSRAKRQDEISQKTHQVLNEAQVIKLRYEIDSQRERHKVLKSLSKTAKELDSVAEKIAIATGGTKRRLH